MTPETEAQEFYLGIDLIAHSTGVKIPEHTELDLSPVFTLPCWLCNVGPETSSPELDFPRQQMRMMNRDLLPSQGNQIKSNQTG